MTLQSLSCYVALYDLVPTIASNMKESDTHEKFKSLYFARRLVTDHIISMI